MNSKKNNEKKEKIIYSILEGFAKNYYLSVNRRERLKTDMMASEIINNLIKKPTLIEKFNRYYKIAKEKNMKNGE